MQRAINIDGGWNKSWRSNCPEGSRRGSIFFVVLWTIVLLAIFAVSLGHRVQQKIRFVNRLEDKNKVYLIALAGVNRAIAQIKAKKKEYPEYDCLKDTWSSNPESFREIPAGEGKFSISYSHRSWENGDVLSRFGAIDEERKINVNKAGREMISFLFQRQTGFDRTQADEIAASIIDWRDADNKNSPLESIEELLLIKSIDEKTFSRIKDYVTVYTDGKININTVEGLVLVCLGLKEELADKIIRFRRGHDSIEATDDDNAFSAISNIISDLHQFCELSQEERQNLSNLISQGLFTVCSENFMIKSQGKLDGRDEYCKIVCIFRTQEGKIVYWQRQNLGLASETLS
ncbi:MAG: general secretion pathway protein GspK [Candidatus Omnitrophica bacterium]|nr:general secretion pathway protein GspK [Candidatus Omnitrophota bacterium]